MEQTSGTPNVSTNPKLEDAESWAWLARLRHPQGRKGEILAEILTDFPEKFAERRQLWLVAPNSPAVQTPAPRRVELIHHWPHKGGIVLHFAGIDSINAAELLSGLMVAIPEAERAELGEDEVYLSDLIGCELVDLAGPEPVCLGPIEDVDRTAGPTALLVVHSKKGELLVPFAKTFLRRMDLANKRIEMALPEGLVDLNV
jgi:16S rRNA processing protein RimM